MTAPVITTSQFIVTTAAYTMNDVPSGTFTATKITLANTEAAQIGDYVSITEGVTTETSKILSVLSSTEVVVEELVNAFTASAILTFLGRTNTGDPTGQTLVKNATGFKVNGSKWTAEVHHNPVSKDILELWKYVKDSVIRSDGNVLMASALDFALHEAKNLVAEQLADDPNTGLSTGRIFYTTDDDRIKAVIAATIDALVTDSILNQHIPVGAVLPLASANISSPYISATGQTLNRSGTYADLYGEIGTVWGNGLGDGLTFTNADLRGRALIGSGTGSGLTARTLGQTLGSERVTLSKDEMPKHRHTMPFSLFSTSGEDGGARNCLSTSDTNTGYEGNSDSHQNMQPSAVVNWIIKYRR